MRFIKNHFGFILPVFLICFSFELAILINQITKDYEKKLYNDYSVIVVSNKELNQDMLNSVSHFSSLNKLSTDEIIDKLKSDISNKNLNVLKSILPKFYAIKFEKLLDIKSANIAKEQLLKIDGVSKVETFSKTSDKVYKLLMFIKFISYVFLTIIALLSFMVFLKQVGIWIIEHKEKFEIMDIYGADSSFKSMFLYKKVVWDCIFSFFMMLLLFYNLDNIPIIVKYLQEYEIVLPDIDYIIHISIICFGVLISSIFGVNIVMYRVKKSA